jgi:predicted nuclease of predicted toxin-antitoxin system
MHRASDQTILAKAMAEDRMVITFDLDFGTLAARAGDRSPGIVLFRLNNARLATVIARLDTRLSRPRTRLPVPRSFSSRITRLPIRDVPIGGA